ncbi:MAG: sulfatase-like hydrolase/transferase [Polyangiaceae bacterium]|nr:sulfatase-like hydrolase/transferase [Polyangiaceae bacterium]
MVSAGAGAGRHSAFFAPFSAELARCTLAVLWVWAFALLELVAVLALERARLTGFWEVQFGILWLLPSLLLVATAVALLGAIVWALVTHEHAFARALSAVSVGLILAGFGWGVGGGRHLSSLGLRGGFALFTGLFFAAIWWWVAPKIRRFSSRNGWLWRSSLVAATIGFELANQLILVRLYPAFHLCLSVLATFSVVGLAFSGKVPRFWGRSGALLVPSLTLLVILTCGLTLAPSARNLAGFDNFRLILFETAPSARYAIKVAASVAPPPTLEPCIPRENVPCDAVGEAPTGSVDLDLRGRSVLLVSVDALRADHVGAYGYQRNTTPNIDELARTATLFDRAYAPTPHTSYSITSLMTGKYMRPLLLQGNGGDSITWAEIFRTYGYKTAAFFPPAVFFIDGSRFSHFQEKALGFEYKKEEFAEGDQRVGHVRDYLKGIDANTPAFVWVHLFGPHEPYENHSEHPFGDRDIDRYDSEIRAADTTFGKLVRLMRERDPNTVVVLTADHGEEFGEHGGRYHGSSVYEEQVRVPLIVQIPGHRHSPRVSPPVQTIDLLPTFLDLLKIPIPPRIRGKSLGPWLVSSPPANTNGLALAETDEQTLLAEGNYRLVCARRVGACALYDIISDPGERRDLSRSEPQRFANMRAQLTALGESHGRFEQQGLRAEGKGWPAPILRAMSGDGDVALDVAALLDDSDGAIRAKAAEELFDLRRPETAPALRLALRRDEAPEVKRWAALALTRFGEGAPLTIELLQDPERKWRRLSALTLAEDGNDSGKTELLGWWNDPSARDFERSKQILKAIGRIRDKGAVYALTRALGDVRLRPEIANALAAIGDEGARGPLLTAFTEERYQNTRVALSEALLALDIGPVVSAPLVRFLGVPDPLPNGLKVALQSRALEFIGGPTARELSRLQAQSELGALVHVTVPPGGNGRGVRVLVRARSLRSDGWVRVSSGKHQVMYNSKGKLVTSRNLPTLDNQTTLELRIPAGPDFVQIYGPMAAESGAVAGRSAALIVVAAPGVEVESLAVVPLSDELPPPAPQPWQPSPASQ